METDLFKVQDLKKTLTNVRVTNCSATKSEMHAKYFCLVGKLSGKRRLTEKDTEGIP